MNKDWVQELVSAYNEQQKAQDRFRTALSAVKTEAGRVMRDPTFVYIQKGLAVYEVDLVAETVKFVGNSVRMVSLNKDEE